MAMKQAINERSIIMNELIDMRNGTGSLAELYTSDNGFMAGILNAIPLAIAAPILRYQRTKAQRELLEIAIEAKRLERVEILKTIQVLAQNRMLTSELAQLLMAAYYQPAF